MFDKDKYKLAVIVAYDAWMSAARQYVFIPDADRHVHATNYVRLCYGEVGFKILTEYLEALGAVK